VSRKVFYDLDTPITLERLARGEPVAYLPPQGLSDFDLVLSYTGGDALEQLSRVLGARRSLPLYGGVDPQVHKPRRPVARYRSDLAYLGTYAPERQAVLQEMFLAPAEHLPAQRFTLAGSQYPTEFPWRDNIYYFHHLPSAEHASFYCSARLNLNVTREPMARLGYCPSGRLFEAAACEAGVVTDYWRGLEEFYERDAEVLVAGSCLDIEDAMRRDDAELARMRHRARERTLDQHTLDRRAGQLIEYLEQPLTGCVHSEVFAS